MFLDQTAARRIEQLETAMAQTYVAAHARRFPAIGSDFLSLGSGGAGFAGADHPYSRASGLGLDGPLTSDELDRIERFYSRHGVPASIDLCSLAAPEALAQFQARGYRIAGPFRHVLVRPLDGAPLPAPIPDITIETVGPARADDWVETVTRGFAAPEEPTAWLRDLMRPMVELPGVTCLLARIDGAIAGAGKLFLHDGIAELSSAATLPEYRRRGVQTALIADRLQRAAAAGCTLAVLATSPGTPSQQNAMRQGFTLAYSKVVVTQAGAVGTV